MSGPLLALAHRYVDANGAELTALDPKWLLEGGVGLIPDIDPNHVCERCRHMTPEQRRK